MRKHVVLPAIAGFLLAVAWVGFTNRATIRDDYARWKRGPVPAETPREDIAAAPAPQPSVNAPAPEKPSPAPAPKPAPTTATLPVSVNLKVAFVPQTPLKNWDDTHEDTCEEASMLMLADVFARGGTPAEMDAAILAIVDFEKSTVGDWKSTDADTTVAVMNAYFKDRGITAAVRPIVSIDDVKRALAAGSPVMLPASGHLLKNPNFKNGGPVYHMLVAKGYTADGRIVTNDPGTRLGEDYVYDAATLWDAIHDWNGGDVLNGAKVMIVLVPPSDAAKP
jgi:hypothetical protein